MAHTAAAPRIEGTLQNARLRSLVIIGGGFAGAALAYHVLRHASPVRVTIIERNEQLGRGLAYAADHPSLRLNVPAARMSLDPERPDDFVQFAGCEATPQDFLPRRQYGAYIDARLAQVRSAYPDRVQVVRGAAVALDEREVQLADGRCFAADRFVIATGLAAQSGGMWPDDTRIVDAWNERACERKAQAGRILLVGSGLSAIDALQLLHAGGHCDEIVMLSRHGLLPRPHAAHGCKFQWPEQLGPAPARLGALLRWGRAAVREAERAGCSWQHVLDALRPQLPQLWQQLSVADRARFVRLVRPYWEVLRHRAPPEALAMIEAMQAQGQLRVLAGRALACEAHSGGLDVTLRSRGGEVCVERFAGVVRCQGGSLELDLQSSPLMAALVRGGLARIDATKLGIVTAEHGRIVDAAGHPSQHLFALGQPCRASRWETTSVPEIVRDARALAQLFAAEALGDIAH
jgi:uncharacterized NAD(P)/FAD-binding protein YdhS